MGKKITLADIAKILKKDKTKGDTSYWGVVQSVNTTDGKVTSYNVSLGGDAGTVKCRKLAGAEVGDTVLVTLRNTGEAVVTGTKNGDKDALNAQNNYFWHDTNGAHVSLLEKSTTNVNNVLIDSNGMEVRNGGTTLSKFASSLIELGKNSASAVIKMCAGGLVISRNDNGYFYMSNQDADASSDSAIYMRSVEDEAVIELIANSSDDSLNASITIKDTPSSSWISLWYKTYITRLFIGDEEVVDFVTDQGTSLNWNYRKWKSGKKECWCTVSQQIDVTSGSGPYYGSGTAVSFPSSFFSSTPMIQMSQIGSTGGWLGVADSSAASSSVTAVPRFYRLSSASGVTITLSIYAIGS